MDWISVLALLAGALSLFIGYRLLIEFLSEVHNKIVLENISKRDRIRREVLSHTSADSVTFFKTHNKDGKASHSKDYKTTCVRGSREEEVKYREIVVDEDYVDILLSIMDKNKVYYSFRTEDEKSCLLKDIFKNEGIKSAAIFYIKSTYSGIFYVIFSKKDDSQFSDGDIFKFREAVDKVKKLKNVYHKF